LSESKRIHFIGIAGSGMSGLALVAQAQGHKVSGSDRQPSRYLEAVIASGAEVQLDQGAHNITDDIDIVVASAAIRDNNEELIAAREKGYEVWHRARMLAWLGQNQRTLAVAGTHGKTTTSSMLATTLDGLGADPSFVIGGVLAGFNATARHGTGADYVVEADESDESFTMLSPEAIIITNIDMDHLDHFDSIDDINLAFIHFIDILSTDGLLVYCADDEGLTQIAEQSGKRRVSYGFAEQADYRCQAINGQLFIVSCKYGEVSLRLPNSPGRHNMQNATAVLALLSELGHPIDSAAAILATFAGVGRRFEIIGEHHDIQVVDDYGHHPTEIRATLAAARGASYNRVHLLFQPHRYTRTSRLFDQFVDAFTDADSLTMLDLYSAGEDLISGVSSQSLIEAINNKYPECNACLVSAESAAEHMVNLAAPGDVIITLGAGDITNIAPLIVDELLLSQIAEPLIVGGSEPETPSQTAKSQAAVIAAATGSWARIGGGWSAPIFEAYCELEGSISGRLAMNEPMARHTSFRIGGPAGLYIECASLSDLKTALHVIRRYDLSWVVVGKGTNLLVADRGFEGAVLTLGKEFKTFSFPSIDDEAADEYCRERLNSENAANPSELVVAGAGVLLGNLVQNAFKNGYSGLEFAVGIPGTLGGAVYMNAGSADEWISQIISSVLILKSDGSLVRYAAYDLPWAYRSSGIERGDIVLEAELIVQRGNTGHIRARMEGIMKRRQRSQPLSKPNAGSVFKNPDGASAGQLIDALGMKGLSHGGASISDVHANFIVNDGSASAEDVIFLIQEARKKVREIYGFELQTEIRFIGF